MRVGGRDFGNGHPDLAVTNYTDSTVSVLLGNGDGAFQSAVTYSTGLTTTYPNSSEPIGIVAAKLTSDGDYDLAVTDSGNGDVAVLLGDGDGTFQAPVTYAVGSVPWGIAAADLNGDGHVDLAVTNHDDGNVSVLLGNGDGTFQSQQTFSVGSGSSSAPTTIAATDLNGDGQPDLAVSNSADDQVGVLLDEAGTASFAGKPDGTYYFHVSAHDGAGTWSAPVTMQINIDTTPPVTTAGSLSATPDPAWTASATVNLTASDAVSGVNATSGVEATYYKVDGGDQKTYTVAFTLPEGADTVTYWSVDKAGNTENVQTGYAQVDATGPTLTVSGASNGAWVNHAVTLTLKATDSGSGVAAIHYTLDGVAHTVSAATTQVKLAALPNKTHTLTCTATDAVGNTSVVHSLTVHIDTIGPSTDAVAASGRVHKAIVLRYRVRDNTE